MTPERGHGPYVKYFVLGVLVGVAVGLAVGRWWLFAPPPLPLVIPTPAPLPPTPTPLPIQVDISGAVARPGVYSLPQGSRLADLVRAAGGLTEDADRARINLALPLRDGQHVHVPSRGSHKKMTVDEGRDNVVFPLDINRASLKELEAIPGIGPATAERILQGRPYGRVEDLLRVKGIGPATLEKIRPYVTVGESGE